MVLYALLIVLHIIVSIALVVSVLMQSSKGGGLAGSFGGSGITGGVFGGRGAAPFLAKATTVFAVMFMLTSVTLNFVKPDGSSRSTIERALMEGGAVGSAPAVSNEMPVSQDAVDESATDSEQTGIQQETSPEGTTDN